MTERPGERPPGRRMTTGEFRAVPDASANTAEFQAFAADRAGQNGQWDLDAPARNPAKIALLVVGVIVVLAIIGVLAAVMS